MKNQYLLIILMLVVSFSACTRKADVEHVKMTFGSNELFINIENTENNTALSLDEAEMFGLKCMLFAEDVSDLQATLYMSEKIKPLVKKYPESGLLLSYYAVMVGLIARDDENVSNQIKYVNESLKLMNKAVSLDPENSIVRLCRGHLAYSLPPMLNKQSVAREDYDFVIKCYQDESCSLDDNTIAEVFLNRADLFRQEGDIDKSIALYNDVIRLDEESSFAITAKNKLSILEN